MRASKRKTLTPERQTVYGWGLIVALFGGVLLLLPGRESWHAKGPYNVGHRKVACEECHAPSPGNVVGQALGNLMHAVGFTDSASYFIYAPAGNKQCRACHEDPDNRHPVDDFLEPKFADARHAMSVQFCVSCHKQHLGVRVSVTPRVCQHCHEHTALDDDPIDIPHTTLISDQRWGTCLGCHDFHGNHDRDVPELMSERLTEEQIQEYLDGGESPYGSRRLSVIQTMRYGERLDL
jgi:hypothetical protein